MECFNPISIRKSGERFFKDLDHKDKSFFYQVPCGKCPACLLNKRSQWVTRLTEEEKASTASFFLTLTYSPEHIPTSFDEILFIDTGEVVVEEFNNLKKSDPQKWIKRVRKYFEKKPIKLTYFIASEYGKKGNRPHYHALVFAYFDYKNNKDYKAKTSAIKHILLDKWNLGFVDIGTVTEASIKYTGKYIFKKPIPPFNCVKPFQLQSKGIGKSYLTDNNKAYHYSDIIGHSHYLSKHGDKYILPRYYRDKIYNEEQKYELRKHYFINKKDKFYKLDPQNFSTYEEFLEAKENYKKYLYKTFNNKRLDSEKLL